jgi:phosphohistidine phosphatase
MKFLIIIRHAKSSWDSAALSDFERPLNERGKKDAFDMAKRLLKKPVSIDAFISSPAKRAKKTAEIFAKEFGADNVIFIDGLYHVSATFLSEVISNIDDQFHTVAVFSHNPGITEFVNTLTDSIKTNNVPTCGVFAVQVPVDSWKFFESSKKDFWFYDYPKSVID